MGKLFARLIHKEVKTMKDVPTRFKDATIKAYFELYAEVLQDA